MKITERNRVARRPLSPKRESEPMTGIHIHEGSIKDATRDRPLGLKEPTNLYSGPDCRTIPLPIRDFPLSQKAKQPTGAGAAPSSMPRPPLGASLLASFFNKRRPWRRTPHRMAPWTRIWFPKTSDLRNKLRYVDILRRGRRATRGNSREEQKLTRGFANREGASPPQWLSWCLPIGVCCTKHAEEAPPPD